MTDFRKYLLVLILGILLFLIYYIFFSHHVTNVTPQENKTLNIEALIKCLERLKCSETDCVIEISQCQKILQGQYTPLPKYKYTDRDLRDTIEQQIKINAESLSEFYKSTEQYYNKYFKWNLNTDAFILGFQYAFNNIFLYIPLIALGMSLGFLGMLQTCKIFFLLCIATLLAALLVNDTIVDNYLFFGPYLLLFSGVSVLLYNEQKAHVLPIIAVLIGIFYGFTLGSDNPSDGTWLFLFGALTTAAFLVGISSLFSSLFDEKLMDNVMNLLGTGLVIISLVMFALEVHQSPT